MLTENRRDLLAQPGELAVGLPDLLQIHPVIGVNQHITQTGHGPPGDLGMPGAAIRTQALGGFPHHLKAAQQCILQIVRSRQGLEVGNRETKGTIDGGENVPQPDRLPSPSERHRLGFHVGLQLRLEIAAPDQVDAVVEQLFQRQLEISAIEQAGLLR